MDELKNSPYSEFLENALQYVFEHKPDSVTIIAEVADGNPNLTMTSYYESHPSNKVNAIMNLLTDFVMEIIGNNRDYVREILLGEGEDDNEQIHD